MNIAFYVSGNASRLYKILESRDPEVLASTKIIFSDDSNNLYLEDIAAKLSIDYRCLNFKDIIRSADESKSLIMSNTLLGELQKHHVDYCFSFGSHLLVGELLTVYENKIINFHPSILPMFPGMQSIDQALNAKTNLLGNTAHFIDAGIDTGPIIMQNVVSSKLFETGGYEAVLDQQLPMFIQIFNWLKADRVEVENGKVRIQGAQYEYPSFFPKLEYEA